MALHDPFLNRASTAIAPLASVRLWWERH